MNPTNSVVAALIAGSFALPALAQPSTAPAPAGPAEDAVKFGRDQLKGTTREKLKGTTREELKGTTREELKGTTREELKGTTREKLKGTTREKLKGTAP
jgi:hypothetical protein